MAAKRTLSYAVAAIALTLTVLGTGAVTKAQSGPDSPEIMATLICRPVVSNETATAKLVKDATLLSCRPFGVALHMSDGSLKTIGSVTARAATGPNFSAALTPQQIDAAYNHWIEQTFRIDPAIAHTP